MEWEGNGKGRRTGMKMEDKGGEMWREREERVREREGKGNWMERDVKNEWMEIEWMEWPQVLMIVTLMTLILKL